MVCRPGLAHQRLTPGNCHELLFDDVIWVHEAQKDHYDFVLKMEERGVEVLDLHDLLAQTLEDPEARASCSTGGLPPITSASQTPRDAALARRNAGKQLAEHLIGGIAIADLPDAAWKMLKRGLRRHGVHHPADPEHAVPARPVLLDLQRRDLQPDVLAGAQAGDPAAAGRLQVPSDFKGGDFKIWWGDSDEDFADASMEGGDVMPIGKGVVLIGMGERTTHQAVVQVARELFRNKAATRVIGCLMPKSRAAMHLDTVFSFCDRDLVTIFREVVEQIRCYSVYPTSTTTAGSRSAPTTSRCSTSSATPWAEDAARRRDRRRRLRGRARAMGRRQQRRGARARRGRRLRPQHLHQHPAAEGRHRGHHHPRRRARAAAAAVAIA